MCIRMCMCMCMWLQPVGHAVAACHTCGCSLWHLRLQAGSLAYLSRMAEEGALSAELAAWLDEGLGAEMVANRSLLLGPSGEVPPYYQHMRSTCNRSFDRQSGRQADSKAQFHLSI